VVEKITERTIRVAELLQDLIAQNIVRNGVEYVQGTAKVGSDRIVLVTSPGGEHHELLAKNILVATGSRPFHALYQIINENWQN
jgi:pyruvate/2-oxoglutarate dehydrogenase complex dihydrolipoamide dehydrogenase (E3) component